MGGADQRKQNHQISRMLKIAIHYHVNAEENSLASFVMKVGRQRRGEENGEEGRETEERGGRQGRGEEDGEDGRGGIKIFWHQNYSLYEGEES